MLYMILLFVVLSFLSITSYTTVVCIKQKGVPYSISETFYRLEHKLWFEATMFLTAGLLMPVILDVTPESYQFTAFLACAGMMLVGVAPNFREGIERPIHIAGAILCLVFSQVWVGLTCPWFLLVWIVYVIYTVVMMARHVSDRALGDFLRTKPMFWVGATALVVTYMVLLWSM